jgi:hypothetical protein
MPWMIEKCHLINGQSCSSVWRSYLQGTEDHTCKVLAAGYICGTFHFIPNILLTSIETHSGDIVNNHIDLKK